jgi:hypothetical protein
MQHFLFYTARRFGTSTQPQIPLRGRLRPADIRRVCPVERSRRPGCMDERRAASSLVHTTSRWTPSSSCKVPSVPSPNWSDSARYSVRPGRAARVPRRSGARSSASSGPGGWCISFYPAGSPVSQPLASASPPAFVHTGPRGHAVRRVRAGSHRSRDALGGSPQSSPQGPRPLGSSSMAASRARRSSAPGDPEHAARQRHE